MIRRTPRSTLFPTRRSSDLGARGGARAAGGGARAWGLARPRFGAVRDARAVRDVRGGDRAGPCAAGGDRKSTRLNSSHANISYAVFCLQIKPELVQPSSDMA